MTVFYVNCGDAQEMIDIKILKEDIEKKTLSDNLLIFVNNESSFLSNQYIDAIKEIHNLTIKYIEDLDFLKKPVFDIFSAKDLLTSNELRVYKCSSFLCKDVALVREKNIIVVCDKYDEKNPIEFNDYVVYMPKLEDWMIKDYVYSYAEGADESDLDWLIHICGNNIDRLQQELEKITLFDTFQRKIFLKEFKEDSMIEDLSNYTIFSLTNAIQSRDMQTLRDILLEIENVDVEAVGLVKVLWQNFKKMIDVWMNPNPTPENTGLKSNQIYAIRNLPRVYSKQQLINIVSCLSEVDYKLKSGELDASTIIDYVLIKVLSM